MQHNTFDAGATARWLLDAHRAGEPFRPFADAQGIGSLADAYAVQQAYVGLQRAARKVHPVGYKIGLTSPAMQAMCGIDTPVAGVVLADRVHAGGAALAASGYGRFGIEFEIAVRLRADLLPREGRVELADVEAAVEAVAPAIEVVDDRGCDYATLDVRSLVADNAWNAGIVLGQWQAAWPALDAVEGVVRDGAGTELGRGRGTDVLGHPFASVAWLARHLHAQGERLRAGELVMTGSMVRTRFPAPGEAFRFAVEGLGAVDLAVTH